MNFPVVSIGGSKEWKRARVFGFFSRELRTLVDPAPPHTQPSTPRKHTDSTHTATPPGEPHRTPECHPPPSTQGVSVPNC